jgi:hypothetical protein
MIWYVNPDGNRRGGTRMKYDIFVSYRRSDRELVASVVRRLEARGVGVWYDAEIEGGADWRETIVEALTNSDMLAIFFSDDCNNSRQLKKELAIADHLGKPVVPILIEDTQPRGAYLYELADRNWIQIFPEPLDRVDELVEHLVTLAGKDGLSGAKVAANDIDDVKKKSAAPGAPVGGAPAASAIAAPAPEAEQPLAEAVEEFISGADQAARPAPKIAKAYVGRVSKPGKPIRKLNDIPPFRWIDLAFLVPAWIAIGAWGIAVNAGGPGSEVDRIVAEIAMLGVLATGLYGAVAFPVRYYLRRRPVIEALWKYLVSELMIFIALFGVMLAGVDRGYLDVDLGQFFRGTAIIWAGFAIIAFVIYGILAGQRAIRSFRSNIRKI